MLLTRSWILKLTVVIIMPLGWPVSLSGVTAAVWARWVDVSIVPVSFKATLFGFTTDDSVPSCCTHRLM